MFALVLISLESLSKPVQQDSTRTRKNVPALNNTVSAQPTQTPTAPNAAVASPPRTEAVLEWPVSNRQQPQVVMESLRLRRGATPNKKRL
jgi:hypothetical protein